MKTKKQLTFTRKHMTRTLQKKSSGPSSLISVFSVLPNSQVKCCQLELSLEIFSHILFLFFAVSSSPLSFSVSLLTPAQSDGVRNNQPKAAYSWTVPSFARSTSFIKRQSTSAINNTSDIDADQCFGSR